MCQVSLCWVRGLGLSVVDWCGKGLLGPASRARIKKTTTRSVIMKKEEEVTMHSPVYTQGLLVIEGT